MEPKRVGADIEWTVPQQSNPSSGATDVRYEPASQKPHIVTPVTADITSAEDDAAIVGITSPPGAWKRALDLTLAVPMLIFLFPVLAMIGLAVRLGDGGNAIYAQPRRGRNGETFKCYKFRTMVPNADAHLKAVLASDPELAREWERDSKLRRDPRITPLGRFLRKSSLDELPQLLNIIRGEMSVVGPRPIPLYEAVRYKRDIACYDAMRPGVVGLWQISGRSDTCYEERVQIDAQYARTRSFWGDVIILLRAIPVVLFGRGAY